MPRARWITWDDVPEKAQLGGAVVRYISDIHPLVYIQHHTLPEADCHLCDGSGEVTGELIEEWAQLTRQPHLLPSWWPEKPERAIP